MTNALRCALLLAVSGVWLFAACGNSDDSAGGEATGTPVVSVTAEGTPGPTASPTPGSLEALAAYLQESGLDGDTGKLTDPLDCALIDNDTDGDYCIRNNVSIYGVGSVVLYVADVSDIEKKVWEVHVTLNESSWEITQVENLAPGQ